MKKILIIIMVLVAGSASTYALNPSDYEVFCKINNSSTFKGLVRYLDIENEQADNLKYLFDITSNEMKTALKADNEKAAEKAMNFNLSNARNILTSYQYKKYLTVINLTINNGNEEEVFLSEK